jgi:hypothetical protein
MRASASLNPASAAYMACEDDIWFPAICFSDLVTAMKVTPAAVKSISTRSATTMALPASDRTPVEQVRIVPSWIARFMVVGSLVYG